MGSVKDLEIITPPTEDSTGQGRFIFSDRYSVFDWGEMPDHIPDKGASIALLAAFFFERLENMGIKTHYIGLIEDGRCKELNKLNAPSNIMEIHLVRVLEPTYTNNGYDYSVYKSQKGNFLIPLEIIYRNSVPEGSSLLKRMDRGEISPEDLGLSAPPQPGEKLERALYDVSTKLEITDRYITWQEAKEIASLSESELQEIHNLTDRINRLITEEFAKIGLNNEDGKIELAFDTDRKLMVVDVLGTLDECRFTYNGIPVSKEIARLYYRKTDWYHAVEEAKKKDRMNWKALVNTPPEPLPPRLKELISLVYKSCTNAITGKDWFPSVPEIQDILEELRGFLA